MSVDCHFQVNFNTYFFLRVKLLPQIGPIPIVIPFKLFLVIKRREIQISNNLIVTLTFCSEVELVIL